MARHFASPLVSTQAPVDLKALQGLYDAGQYDRALRMAKKAIRQFPDRADLMALAASCARHLRDHDTAVWAYRRAIKLSGTGSDYTRHLGNCLLEAQQPEGARDAFLTRLRACPTDAQAWHGLGEAYVTLRSLDKAVTALAEALRLQPNAPVAHALGVAFEQDGLNREALDSYDLACQLAPDQTAYVVAKARVAHLAGQTDLALQILTHAEQTRSCAAICEARANIYLSMGRPRDARASFRHALELDPQRASTYANFVRHADMRLEPEIDANIRDLLQGPLSDEHRMWLLNARAKIEEDHERYAEAYAALEQANALRRTQLRYDPKSDAHLFEMLKSEFAGASARVGPAQDGPTPIFITGLPRSGTTLVETILSRHSNVTAMGELDSLGHAVRRSGEAGLEEAYVSGLPSVPQTPFFTDKMPLNFRLIGHIATRIPQARIVHVYRDPKATCWSIYRTYFAGSGNGFAYSERDILAYYQGYADLMQFWHQTFPGRVVDLDYEALVANPEPVCRMLLSGLGLSWDAACLAPQDAGRTVNTASSAQVRQAIYGGSRERWKRYLPRAVWLNELDTITATDRAR
jgi:tetratricopeptide (TPR) repeat protein